MSVRQILDSTGKIGAAFLPNFIQNDLQSPVLIQGGAPATAGLANIQVNGNNASVYGGSLGLDPGTNAASPAQVAGVNIRAIASGGVGGCAVEIGTDGVGIVNTLGIAGALGVSQVYNPIYNQPMALRPIVLSNTNPLAVPIAGNVGEIFRCVQAGVAAASVAAIGTNLVVPRTGFYTLQIEYKLQNAPAPAAADINVPIAAVGGIDLGSTMTFSFSQGVVNEPYGVSSVVSQEFAVAAIVQVAGGIVRRYTSSHLLVAGTIYTFNFSAISLAGPLAFNIGSAGQIKAELIAMC